MIHSYTIEQTIEQTKYFYTAIVGADHSLASKMAEDHICYDFIRCGDTTKAKFLFVNAKEYTNFHEKHDIIEVYNEEEFDLIVKLIR